MLSKSMRNLLVVAVGLAVGTAIPAWGQTAAPMGDSTAAPATMPAAASPATEAAPLAVAAPAIPAAATAPAGNGAAAASATPEVATEGKDLEDLWASMIHFMAVARPDVAASYAQAILNRPEAAGQLYLLADKTPGAMARLNRAAGDKDLKPLVTRILALIEKGYATQRSDPKRIAEAIQYLKGTPREFELGSDRLKESGEYSVPQLVQELRGETVSEAMKDRITTFLPQLKLSAVRPLSEALQMKNAAVVARVAKALGEIGYPHAAPMLREVLDRPDFADGAAGSSTATLRRTVETALAACSPAGTARASAAQLYLDLAEQYYNRAESLTLGVGAESGNVWFWSDEAGLTYVPAPAPIFCDVYAMRHARAALRLDAKMAPAVSLWLAADVKREADLPAGAKDPTVPQDQPAAKYYLLSAGAKYVQEVLARGLKEKNVAVAVGAIEALARTAGAKSLVIPSSGGSLPLVDAMSFGDGRVRFLAAVTLGSALPQERFAGWEKVVPTLNDALMMAGGRKRAAMISDGSETGNKVKAALRAGDWDVIDGAAAADVLKAAGGAGGADLVVIVMRDDAGSIVRQFRGEPWAKAFLAIGRESAALSDMIKDDASIKMLPPTADDAAVKAAAESLAQAGGPAALSPEQQAQWAIRAAGVIRLLADTDNKVFDVRPAMTPLASLLNDKRADVRLAAASALAAMPAQAAQQAIAKLALAVDLDEKVRLAALNLATESVRRFGNQFAPDHEKGVQELVTGKGSPELRDAAAQLQGALSLSSEKVKGMILDASPK
jgi:hypothetical protein